MITRGNIALGRKGEEVAAEYLQGLGHTVLERNWRSGHLEIDLITKAPDGLHFVEVKSIVAPSISAPEEHLTRTKRDRITVAAMKYLKSTGGSYEVFFDAATVIFRGDSYQVSYYPSAWIPIYV